MLTANWPVSAIFNLWFCNNKKLLVNIVNLVRTCLRMPKRRQAVQYVYK